MSLDHFHHLLLSSFWPEFLWSHWCCSLCIPSFILFDSQHQRLRNPAKKGRGQTCDIFWAMYVYVTQQGSFPSKMEIACIAAAVSSDGWKEWLGRPLSAASAGLIPDEASSGASNKGWWKGRVKTCSTPVLIQLVFIRDWIWVVALQWKQRWNFCWWKRYEYVLWRVWDPCIEAARFIQHTKKPPVNNSKT